MKGFLSNQERRKLREQHRKSRERRQADRMKAVLLVEQGWTYERIAEALLVDEVTIRRWENRYRSFGLKGLLRDRYEGGQGKLNDDEETQLREHLEERLYQTTKEIILYVKAQYGVVFSESGMQQLLHRLGFVYKKTRRVPSKADVGQQKEFIDQYLELKNSKKPGEKILFADGCHPQHNSLSGYGWILKGQDADIPANTGRKRLNLNGALDPQTLKVTICNDDTLNSGATIGFFKKIEACYPLAPTIYIILDNAGYYRGAYVAEYLKTSRIKLVFLPPYSPNLNLIERLWGLLKRKLLYNKFFPTFVEFKNAVLDFFARLRPKDLRSLITEKFQVITPKFASR